MILGPLLVAQVETSPGIATSLDAIKSMLDQLDLQMGASRALEHPCAPAMRAVGCDGFECFRAAVRESNVELSSGEKRVRQHQQEGAEDAHACTWPRTA